MRIRLKIQQRIQFFILGSGIIVFIIAIGYISYSIRDEILSNAKNLAECQALKYASKIEKDLKANIVISRTLAKVIEAYLKRPENERKALVEKIYPNVLEINPQIDAIWDEWDQVAFDSVRSNEVRYGYMSWWEDNTLKGLWETYDYYSASSKARRDAGIECIREPYKYKYPNEPDSVLVTDLNHPIYDDQHRYAGCVAIDFRLVRFQEIVSKIKFFDNSFAMLFGNTGSCIGHTDTEKLGKNIKELYPQIVKNHNLLLKIETGESFNFIDDLNEDEYYFTFKTIEIGRTYTPWSLCIVIPLKEINKLARETFYVAAIVCLIGLLCLGVLIWVISKNITNPIRIIINSLKGLSAGQIGSDMKLDINTGDEIENMGLEFNKSLDALNEKARFAEKIGQGNLDADMKLLGDNDILGESLLGMRDSLQQAREDEKFRKTEDDRRRWTNEGLAKFGDILRQNNDDLENLSFEIIKELITYLKANQGSIFIINDDDPDNIFLQNKATYAFSRRKYIKKNVPMGHSLTGICALESEKIYLTNIPEDYIQIKSGFGDPTPKNLLLIPVKFEESSLGVIEIASDNEFTDFEVEFVEKIAESVASTISSVHMNARTTELLAQSKQQSEELAAQEEEMRQNLEELQATQEEAARKSVEMERFVNALNSSSYMVEYDLDKRVINMNDIYLDLYGMKRNEVLGLYHSDNMEFNDEQRKNYEKFWDDLKKGKVKYLQSVFTIRGEKYNLMETFTPIKDEYGEVYKVLKIAYDMNEYI